MGVDPIAVAGLVVAIVGSVAAMAAAYFAWKAPTRDDLAKVEEHLRLQNDRHALDARAQAVHISVHGEAWNDEPMTLRLTLGNSDFVLTRLDLVNEIALLSGSLPCTRINDRVYECLIGAQAFGKWYQSGRTTEGVGARLLWIKVRLNHNSDMVERRFPLQSVSVLRQGPKATTYYTTVSGES